MPFTFVNSKRIFVDINQNLKNRMPGLSLPIAILPGIALLLDIVLFTILMQNTNQKKRFSIFTWLQQYSLHSF